MSRPQFSIRTLLWLTLVVAIGCVIGPPAWDWYDDYQLTREAERLADTTIRLRHRLKWKDHPEKRQRAVESLKRNLILRREHDSPLSVPGAQL